MLAHSKQELYRYNVHDIMVMLKGCSELYAANLIGKKDMAGVHKTVEDFLKEYLEKAKKEITGRQLAKIISLIGDSKTNWLHDYDDHTWR